jgi:iron complex outermembrane receptor protein
MSAKSILTTPVAAFLAVHCAALAQEYRLPETVVAATKPSLTVPFLEAAIAEIRQTPGGVAVVDTNEVRKGRATTLKDALDFAPGVFIQPRYGAEESRISIRGSGIQRTFHGRGIRLLQDGVPLNLADGGFDFQAVEPLASRYIEVYRGANALEFGATTLGGAVNFVSLTGHDAPRLSLRGEYGSFESYRAQFATAGVSGPLDWYASFSHFSQDGFREHSQQNNQRLFANVGYRIDESSETRFFITWAQTDSELPGNLTKLELETNPRLAARVPESRRGIQPVARFDNVTSNWKRDFDLFRIANRTTWETDEHRLSLGAFWAYKDLDHPILFVIDQLSNDFGLDLRYDCSGELAGHKNKFTIGFAPTYGIVQDNRFDNVFGNRGAKFADNEQTSLNLALYLQDSFRITPAVALVAGAQVTYAARDNEDDFPTGPDNSDRQDWWGFSPRLGVLWDITPDAQAYANVSRSFEPPSFGELVNANNGGAGLIELDAQTATTFEIGTRGKAGAFAWDIAYYHAWLDDELLEFQVQPGLTQTVNAGRTIHQGIEAALDIDLLRGILARDQEAGPAGADGGAPGPGRDRLVLRQIYLWSDFRFDGDATFGDNQLPGIPEHYYRAELMYEHPSGFYFGPNVEWVPQGYHVDSANTLQADSYALLGAKIGWRSARGFSVFLEAKNLTDEIYAATTGVVAFGAPDSRVFLPGDGRGFFAGFELKF